MPLFLRERNRTLREYMDDPNCNLEKLHATYTQFETVNRLIGGWGRIYKTFIRPALLNAGNQASVLDIGCGGGDILRLIDRFCQQDDITAQLTGIEPDERAIQYLEQQAWPENFTFLNNRSGELVADNHHYSVVISNHLVHHLQDDEIKNVCHDAEIMAEHCVIFSDIERSDIGYSFFSLIAPIFFRNSFIAADGTRSIRRSFQKDELSTMLPDGWRVQRQFPFRLLAIYPGDKT